MYKGIEERGGNNVGIACNSSLVCSLKFFSESGKIDQKAPID